MIEFEEDLEVYITEKHSSYDSLDTGIDLDFNKLQLSDYESKTSSNQLQKIITKIKDTVKYIRSNKKVRKYSKWLSVQCLLFAINFGQNELVSVVNCNQNE